MPSTRTPARPDPRNIEYVPLADLRANPANPKNHDERVIDQSIGRFGILDLIVRDERTGYIVSGHGRHKVLSSMHERGESPPEGVRQTKDGEWLVPVVTGWASRTDLEASAALVAMNRTTELGGWVDESLLGILDDLAAEDGPGLDGIGFDQRMIDRLSRYVESTEALAEGEDPSFGGEQAGAIVSNVTYLLAFEDEDQKAEWTTAIRTLRRAEPGATIASLVIAALQKQAGAVDGQA